MKKIIALLLVLALTLSLCACAKKVATDNLLTATDANGNPITGENAGNNGGENAQDSTNADGGADQEGDEPFDITQLTNYYQDLSEPQFVEDQLTFQIFQAWYEEGDLYMDIYFINGHAEPVYDVWFDEIGIFNGDMEEDGELVQGGLIAFETMGPVGLEEPIEGNTYKIVTLRFRADIESHLVDLSLDIHPEKYSYEWGFAED